MIRVALPYHLQRLAGTDAEVRIALDGPATICSVLDALEVHYPMLRGTIRDHVTHQRRPFIRFYACGEDLSLESSEFQLPDRIASGQEVFLVLGAIAGG